MQHGLGAAIFWGIEHGVLLPKEAHGVRYYKLTREEWVALLNFLRPLPPFSPFETIMWRDLPVVCDLDYAGHGQWVKDEVVP